MGSIALHRTESIESRVGSRSGGVALVERGQPLRDRTNRCLFSSGDMEESLDPFSMAGVPRGWGIGVPRCSHSATHSHGPATGKCGIHP
jgi:hypothetical protein